ncbi:MAG: diadenylate cyclase CdaA [Erysipelotrichaceae bacterium]
MSKYLTLANTIQVLRVLLDIGIVWVLVYYTLKIVKNNTKTIQIFKGIIFVIFIKAIANQFGLVTLDFLASNFINWGFLAVIIIFQPEIRGLLENLGKTSVFSKINTLTVNERENLVNEMIKSVKKLSDEQTGAIISIEQGTSLGEFVKTGTKMNSIVTSELLCSIFLPGTPLHDGAVIIQGDKIACASAYFPPTALDYPSNYGARHRAAIGISEISDCVTIVVSEETGTISIAEKGKLKAVNLEELQVYLMQTICMTQSEVVVREKVERRAHNEHGSEANTQPQESYMSNLLNRAKNMIAPTVETPEDSLLEAIEIVDLTQPKKRVSKPRKPRVKKENKPEVVAQLVEEVAPTVIETHLEDVVEEEVSVESKDEVVELVVSQQALHIAADASVLLPQEEVEKPKRTRKPRVKKQVDEAASLEASEPVKKVRKPRAKKVAEPTTLEETAIPSQQSEGSEQ